ncbi:MAG: FAD:protein FMN transferase [Tannerella sp.]|jgi:thiamine biosynthesis lipoprotein|nr:FAD:protein FMN transferase [Tannerella sp.]
MWCVCLSCTHEKKYYEESGSVFHTSYHIKYESAGLLTDKIDAELQAFSLSMNPFNPNSIISKVNRNEEVEVDDRFATVFNKAMEVSENSDGVFDVTVSPLINLWGFGFENSDSISQEKIDSILSFVGYKKIRLENKRIIKDDPRMTLNFSAIAKGFASDVIAALLEREGVENYMVEIGGEVAAKGKNPHGKCWQVGIPKPEDDPSGLKYEPDNIISLCGKRGCATSGNYRNFYLKDGKKYAHTIDPRTGYPSEQSLLSATILAPDCMTADAYATAFMALGIEAACKMAEKIPEIEYYLIYSDGSNYKAICSAGLTSLLRKTNHVETRRIASLPAARAALRNRG